MALSADQETLVTALQEGLPLVPRPYRALGQRIGMSEREVMGGTRELMEQGLIKRIGVVVHHRALGFEANAMVVWDVPDDRVDAVGEWLGRQERVTLCYRRPRQPPRWPYNLFCMIHGRHRDEVRAYIKVLRKEAAMTGVPYSVLFSTRCFKQRGARYRPADGAENDDGA